MPINFSQDVPADALAAVRDRLDGRREQILTLIRSLVETESPSGDAEGSRAVVSLLEDAARHNPGVDSVRRIESPGYGEHLLVRAFSAEANAGTILLVGHTDTVHPRGSVAARPWRVEEGRAYGPGVFDMKANCVLALEALEACAALAIRPRHPVALVLTCDEETGSHTGRGLIEDLAVSEARCALVLEPPAPGRKVKTARKGTGMFSLRALGRAAHAGLEPEKGASAILELARQIERLHGMNDLALGTTVNVGVVKGGTQSNVVAAEAQAEIDLRFATMEEGLRVESLLLSPQPFDPRVQLSMTGEINRPPLERTEDVAALFALAHRLAAHLDFELGEASVGGASDGNFIAAKGIPVLDGLGVDGDGAHAVHEHVVLSDLATRGALLAGLLLAI